MTHATHWTKKNHRAETGLRSGDRPRVGTHAVAGTRSRVEIISLVALLGATALLYLVGLSASGYANEFYSAAAQAGSTNWWSFLWGSSDAGNSITVDKPPAALWPMALSVKIFGLSSWSILVPQAIMGVLSVWLLYSTVRRTYGHWTGILAGAVLATTPIACLMFRFNNPDALLMLLLLSCVYCVLRACELPNEQAANRSRTRWMALAGVAMGFAFLTKQLQAFLILPGIGIAFLATSPTNWRRKLLDTLAAFGALIVSAGWWVLLTVIVPADMRPYIGGSQTNSFIELTFSYNGLGRITGSMEGAVLPGGSSTTTTISQGQAGMWGQTGITRLFDGVWGTQWSWLAWVALAGIAVGIVCAVKDMRRVHDTHANSSDAPGATSAGTSSSSIDGAIVEVRTSADSADTTPVPSLGHLKLAQVIIWGCWLVVTGLIFSFMGGTIHQYYTVALTPAVAALVAICVAELWRARGQLWALITACVLTGVTAIWATVLLERSDWVWQLRPITLGLGVAAIVIMLVAWQRGHKKATDVGTSAATDSATVAASTTATAGLATASDTNTAIGIDTYPTVSDAYQTVTEATAREATNPDAFGTAASDTAGALTAPTANQPAHRDTASLLDKIALGLALASALVGPVAYSLYTAATPHTGSIVTAGPSVQDDSGMGGPGQGGMGGQSNGQGGPGQMGATDGNGGQQGGQSANGTMGGAPGMSQQDGTSSNSSSDSSSSTDGGNGTSSSNSAMPTPPSGTGDGTGSGNSSTSDGNGTMPTPPSSTSNGTSTDSTSGDATSNGSSATGTDGTTSAAPTMGAAPSGTDSTGSQQGAQPGNGGEGGNGGGMGGLLGGSASSISDELVTALQKDADSYRWVAATVGSQNAASYQLASECSVMPIGGFNGSDPSPTLEQFKEWVAAGKIHYFIAGGSMGGGTQIGGSDYASQITSWVEENFTSTTIGNVTVYDLTQSAS